MSYSDKYSDKYSDLLSGVIERVVFQNSENGFTVLILALTHKTQDSVTVKGYLPVVHAGEQVQIGGTWIMHPKFGKQFEAHSCTTQLPTTLVGLKKYLSSGLIKGIGPVYAAKLVTYFGDTILTIIDEHPERLTEIPGVGAKRVETIVKAWKDHKEISHIMVFLQEKQISPVYATKIYKKYGNNAITIVTQNPYRLAEDIWGIGFKMADQIAQQMGFALNSINRVKAGLLYGLTTILNKGNLYIDVETLKKDTYSLLGLNEEAFLIMKNALHDLYNTQKITLVTHNTMHYVTLTQYYLSEKGVAYKIKKLLEAPREFEHSFDIPALCQELRAQEQSSQSSQSSHSSHSAYSDKSDKGDKGQGIIALNQEQQKGVITCLQQKITVITGGPGTGKTTLIKTLLTILERHTCSYKLAAPTGRAAKRMQEGTGRYAETIHRLLEFEVGTMSFAKNEQNALKTNFLIVDEASMIDIFLAHAILKAVPFNAHLILIGDINQLPSVGAGNFLSDLIASEQVSCIRLATIFRQAQNSLIVVNAHKINEGQFPVTSLPDARRDFLYIKEQEPDNARVHIEHIIKKGLPAFGLTPEDMVVLVPMNRGIVGTQKLNYDIQQIVNSGEKESVVQKGVVFKVDDRVMQIRNNYDKNVFNGDIGTITCVDKKELIVLVRYADKMVEYEFSDLDELVLAYAISIHKSQGSEYPAVIIPLFMQHYMLLQRNLLYTAVTRAKKICILVGQPKAIVMSIKNNKGLVRTTFLKEYLTSDLACR